MNKKQIIIALLFASFMSTSVFAGGRDQAIRECKNVIRDNYSVSNFHKVFAERSGHKKFRVYGKVGHRGNSYPFDCSIKRGNVRSYHYDGPYAGRDNGWGNGGWDNGWGNSWDNDRYRDKKRRHKKRDKNIAIGVGLAALAVVAIAASSNNKSSHTRSDFSYDSNVDKHDLEDECGESLGGRIRREHDGVRRLEIDYSRSEHSGSKISGTGLIHWQQRKPSDVEFTCHFNRDGRVIDSAYSYY